MKASGRWSIPGRSGTICEEVEVEEILFPALLLEVEMVYLCRPDCKGLCPVCGADRNKQDCGCEEKQIDPRLAVLGTLLHRSGE